MTEPEGRTWRPADLLWVAAWFALVTGLAEGSVLAFRYVVLDQFTWSSKHIMWMAPAAYLFFFGAPVAVLALVAWLFPRFTRRWWCAGLAAGCALVAGACFLRLLSLQRIHVAAILLLAAGLAVQVGRRFADPAGRALILVRRTTPWLALVVALVGGSTTAWWAMAERRAIAALSPAAPNAPNVLLLILDTVRAASLSLYGYSRPTTPELDRFARRGVVFERAISTAPWTLPSHAAMFTGRLPRELSTGFRQRLDGTHPTLAEVFRGSGYLTSGFVANQYYTTYQSGLARGFVHYEDFLTTPKQILLSAELGQWISDWHGKLILRTSDWKGAPAVNAEFLRWLSRTGGQGRPFFAFLNYMDGHLPYHTPEAIERRFQGSGNGKADRYDAAIVSLDQGLGNLLVGLEVRGLLEHTIVVIASDHGEQVGEHGLDNHGNSLYLQLLHVPLVIVWPGRVPEGRRVAEPVSLRDLPATILELCGVAAPLPGHSLSPRWTAGAPVGDTLLLAEVERHPTGLANWPNRKGPMQALLAGPYHYIREGDGRELLFNYWEDPAEEHDLVGSPDEVARLEEFRAALERVNLTRTPEARSIVPALRVRLDSLLNPPPS